MKTLFKTTLFIAVLATVMSCKKNDTVTQETYDNSVDSTAIDTVGPSADSTDISKTGTTGATGEGSTGSGSAGTVQKGNTNVNTDSTTTGTKKGR